MKVLIVTPFFEERHGVGIATKRLALGLHSHGHTVTILRPGTDDQRDRGRFLLWEDNVLRTRDLRANPFWGDLGPRWHDPLEIAEVRSTLRAIAPDVIHVHHVLGLGIDVLPLLTGALPDTPVLYTHHDGLAVCEAAGQLLRRDTDEYCEKRSPSACARCNAARENPIDERIVYARNLLSKTILRKHVTMHTTPSKYFADRLSRDLEVPVRVLPNIPTAASPHPRSITSSARRSRLGFFGQLTEAKGVLRLIEAVQRYNHESAIPVSLDIHGGGPLQREIEALIVDNELINYRGPYSEDEATFRMQEIDWLAVPSLWPEVAPMVIYESLAAGTPLMMSRRGGKQEHVDFATQALEVRNDSTEAWVGAIRLSQSDTMQSSWPTMSASCVPPLTISDAVDVTVAAYQGAVRRSSRPNVIKGAS